MNDDFYIILHVAAVVAHQNIYIHSATDIFQRQTKHNFQVFFQYLVGMAASKPDISMLKVGSDLPTDRPPTVLDVVKFGKQYCDGEKNKQKCEIGILTSKTVEAVLKCWQAMFPGLGEKFESEKEVKRRVKVILTDASEVRRGRYSKAKVEAFLKIANSSKVFDILVCKHPILSCQVFGCKEGCMKDYTTPPYQIPHPSKWSYTLSRSAKWYLNQISLPGEWYLG